MISLLMNEPLVWSHHVCGLVKSLLAARKVVRYSLAADSVSPPVMIGAALAKTNKF